MADALSFANAAGTVTVSGAGNVGTYASVAFSGRAGAQPVPAANWAVTYGTGTGGSAAAVSVTSAAPATVTPPSGLSAASVSFAGVEAACLPGKTIVITTAGVVTGL